MNEKYCQSCGMPMGNTDELYGTNADGKKIVITASIVLKMENSKMMSL